MFKTGLYPEENSFIDPKLVYTYKAPPAVPPPPSCAEGVDDWVVRRIVCSSLSPVSDPRLNVLLRLPPLYPDVEEVAARSPINLTIEGMTERVLYDPWTEGREHTDRQIQV